MQRSRYTIVCLLVTFYVSVCSCIVNPNTTEGAVWPLPQSVRISVNTRTVGKGFELKVTAETCDIIEEAIKRYSEVISQAKEATLSTECDSPHSLHQLQLELTSPCQQWPDADMKENYELHVNAESAVLKSGSVWGILRGLETFSQMLVPSKQQGCLVVNHTDILDYPRFSHRGLLLDTSRHYLPVSVILNILSGMEMNKMNVFHWHIVDDQSFPYQSTTFPNLSDNGAYDSKKAIYSQEVIKKIISFARMRGIRVLPEFDSPGHTQSWGKGTSKLLTACYVNGSFDGNFGPVDPSRQENYKFMASLLTEVKNVFPSRYIHIGGDEVDYTCWKSNPAVQKFMKEKNLTTYEELEGYYIKEIINILDQIGINGIVWQEVFVHNANLSKNTLVHIWNGNRTELLQAVTDNGLQALLSQGWYLDHINDQWQTFYQVDPTDFNGTQHQKELVVGGEACMWGEMVDETNIVPRIWPRASAVAERLWSSEKINNIEIAAPRLNEHVCRMKRRGVGAQPANGPGYCSY
ncbi:beta-hexosaminidase subunit beta-like isoform X2 [Macrosteles quadrilineatus]|uniref:beta-hexosaminidase subunit beta-like isoform X2 n=1 Tax=Macrosteles quadrilineatus TaxID=74068 RepID=UPI0023E1A6D3|nr:beta-hexosaminidase subunit beta-like isoform X2 [Macrosteles quadrilineatus]